jgi:hypothetical protein
LTAVCTVYLNWNKPAAGVTGRQGMLTPPRHLIPPLLYPEIRVCPILKFVFPIGLCYFIEKKEEEKKERTFIYHQNITIHPHQHRQKPTTDRTSSDDT